MFVLPSCWNLSLIEQDTTTSALPCSALLGLSSNAPQFRFRCCQLYRSKDALLSFGTSCVNVCQLVLRLSLVMFTWVSVSSAKLPFQCPRSTLTASTVLLHVHDYPPAPEVLRKCTVETKFSVILSRTCSIVLETSPLCNVHRIPSEPGYAMSHCSGAVDLPAHQVRKCEMQVKWFWFHALISQYFMVTVARTSCPGPGPAPRSTRAVAVSFQGTPEAPRLNISIYSRATICRQKPL